MVPDRAPGQRTVRWSWRELWSASFCLTIHTLDYTAHWARGGAVGWGTSLQAGSIPNYVIGIFLWLNPSNTVTLVSTQPLTEVTGITGVLVSPYPDQEGNKLGSMPGTRAISTTSRRELSSFFFLQGKASKEIYAIVTETLTCFVPGRSRDLPAPLYILGVKQFGPIFLCWLLRNSGNLNFLEVEIPKILSRPVIR